MNLSIDQFIYGIGIILIPIIVAVIHKRRKFFPSHTAPTPPNKINEIEGRLKKLEESIIKNHIEIDEAKKGKKIKLHGRCRQRLRRFDRRRRPRLPVTPSTDHDVSFGRERPYPGSQGRPVRLLHLHGQQTKTLQGDLPRKPKLRAC